MQPTNAILASLSAGDSAALRPHLRTVHLESKTMLFEVGDTVNSVYFPLHGGQRWSCWRVFGA
jgi:hypothetical protein